MATPYQLLGGQTPYTPEMSSAAYYSALAERNPAAAEQFRQEAQAQNMSLLNYYRYLASNMMADPRGMAIIAPAQGQGQAAQAQQGAGRGGGAGGTYYGASPGAGYGAGAGATGYGGGTQMANGSVATQSGASPYLFVGGKPLSAAQTNQIMDLYQSYEGGNAQAGQALMQWMQGMGMRPDELNSAVSNLRNSTGPNAAPTIGGAGQVQPETAALGQMAQIDPTGEALRQQLGQTYLSALNQTAAPTAADLTSYLNLYKGIDPSGYAARQQLQSDLAAQERLGTQLDAATAREIDQATREAQTARGNVYGTPQLVQEAMTRGQAGLALQQQRQQALQSYLSSGQTMGDVALNLYNQRMGQLRASQQLAQSYLGSGTTPYQAGASYVDRANAMAAQAAQGGPQYNPGALGGYYTGAGTPSFPQYGLDTAQMAGSWYNNINSANLQAYNLQQAYKPQGANYAGIGSAVGGILGGVVGSVVPGIGTIAGGMAGSALGGAAGGLASSYSR